MNFPKILRELREERNLKPNDVASVLSISPRAYYYYEQGTREPSLETLTKICDYFDVSADFILGRQNY